MSLVELARYPNGIEAEIARTLLESHGLLAVTFDAGMNIADSAAFAIPVRLMVHEDERGEAEMILREADSA
jgi:Putative prokaryotic signal transducing protein